MRKCLCVFKRNDSRLEVWWIGPAVTPRGFFCIKKCRFCAVLRTQTATKSIVNLDSKLPKFVFKIVLPASLIF